MKEKRKYSREYFLLIFYFLLEAERSRITQINLVHALINLVIDLVQVPNTAQARIICVIGLLIFSVSPVGILTGIAEGGDSITFCFWTLLTGVRAFDTASRFVGEVDSIATFTALVLFMVTGIPLISLFRFE
jgi:hypothetical protein